MGLLDRIAMKQERKRLAPFFRGDERFIQTDVMDAVAVQWHDTGRVDRHGQAALTLTNRAIHLRLIKGHGGNVTRIPYEHVMDLSEGPQMFLVTTTKARWRFEYRGSPMGANNFDVIRAELQRFENVNRTIDVPGGQVMAVNKPIEEDGPPAWTLVHSDGVNLADPAVMFVLTEELAHEISKWGPLPGS